MSEYLGETSSTKNIKMLRSMNHRRDKHAPRDLLRKEQDEFDQSPEVQELIKSIAEATAKIGDKPDKNSAQFKERQKLYTKKGMLLRSAKESFREEWFSASFDKEALQQLQQEEDNETEQTSTFPLIRHLMPERNCIANTLFVTKGLQSKEGQAVLQDVYSLCNDNNQVAYQLDEQPVNRVCPCSNCSTVITE